MSQKYEAVGHCGRIFSEFEVCDEVKWDDLCMGCSMNDENVCQNCGCEIPTKWDLCEECMARKEVGGCEEETKKE